MIDSKNKQSRFKEKKLLECCLIRYKHIKARTIENSTADVSASAEIGNYVVTDGGITADWAQGGNPRQLLNFSPAVTANDAYPSPLVDLKDESVFIGLLE